MKVKNLKVDLTSLCELETCINEALQQLKDIANSVDINNGDSADLYIRINKCHDNLKAGAKKVY